MQEDTVISPDDSEKTDTTNASEKELAPAEKKRLGMLLKACDAYVERENANFRYEGNAIVDGGLVAFVHGNASIGDPEVSRELGTLTYWRGEQEGHEQLGYLHYKELGEDRGFAVAFEREGDGLEIDPNRSGREVLEALSTIFNERGRFVTTKSASLWVRPPVQIGQGRSGEGNGYFISKGFAQELWGINCRKIESVFSLGNESESGNVVSSTIDTVGINPPTPK